MKDSKDAAWEVVADMDPLEKGSLATKVTVTVEQTCSSLGAKSSGSSLHLRVQINVPPAPLAVAVAVPAATSPSPSAPGSTTCGLGVLQNVDGPYEPVTVLLGSNYLVTSNPEHPALVGLWSGSSASTWRKVESTLRGGRLFGSGAKVKKVKSLEEAMQLWEKTVGTNTTLMQWVLNGEGQSPCAQDE